MIRSSGRQVGKSCTEPQKGFRLAFWYVIKFKNRCVTSFAQRRVDERNIADGKVHDWRKRDGRLCYWRIRDGSLCYWRIRDGGLCHWRVRDGKTCDGTIRLSNLNDLFTHEDFIVQIKQHQIYKLRLQWATVRNEGEDTWREDTPWEDVWWEAARLETTYCRGTYSTRPLA